MPDPELPVKCRMRQQLSVMGAYGRVDEAMSRQNAPTVTFKIAREKSDKKDAAAKSQNKRQNLSALIWISKSAQSKQRAFSSSYSSLYLMAQAFSSIDIWMKGPVENAQ